MVQLPRRQRKIQYSEGQLPPEEPEPEFLAPLENMTVTQGRHVSFTCVVNHLGSYKVAWIKSDSKAILAIHDHMVTHNPRLAVTHNGHNTWKLHVSNVQKNDSGTYMCQINTDPMRSQMGTLGVLIPPDILDDEASDTDNAAPEGGSVFLRCQATGVPEPAVLWRREDSRNIVFRHDGGREKLSAKTFDGETLLLSSIQRADMGAYLCIASNGVPPSVSKRFIVQVHFHPLIKVSNQLVAAPVTSDVLLECYVEASPKAMNSWYRDTDSLLTAGAALVAGEKLMEGSKYEMEETPLSDYALLMKLTIRSLEKRDFGRYMCASVNALGKVEGDVRLQELHLAPKTTAPAPARHDKARKKPSAHDKPRKKKKKKGERGREEEGDGSSAEEDGDEGDSSAAAGGGGGANGNGGAGGGGGAAWFAPHTTIMPASGSARPPWVTMLDGAASSTGGGGGGAGSGGGGGAGGVAAGSSLPWRVAAAALGAWALARQRRRL
ncbi:hypothetical protein R5R35_002875 [Gryllus longicercus]|uniref:Ig-like domain-containing protein n=1 Tax=Gryllus longicercus TaxID=2509291 RepID=A0AAN9VKE7_9ORTH